jgi:hypothetical protein
LECLLQEQEKENFMSTVPLSSTYSAGSTASAQATSYGAESDRKYVPPSVSVSTVSSAPAQDTVVIDAKLFAQLMAAQSRQQQGVKLEDLTLSLSLEPKVETITFPNGDKYAGDVKDGKPHGKGLMKYFSSGVATYNGDFVDGNAHGQGTKVWTNGNKYEGQFVNGHAEGQGRYQKLDGSYMSGIFKNDTLWTGEMTYSTINGQGVRDISYPEQWKDGYLDSWSTCHNMGCPDCCGMANVQLCVIV